MLGNIFGKRQAVSGQKFVRMLNATDFGLTADVVCQPSDWRTIGSYSVPAQTMATFGADDPTGSTNRAGRITYLRVDATGGQLHGKVRLVITNAQKTREVVVMEERTERLSASYTDRAQAVLLPEYPVKAKEDSKLEVRFYPDSATAVTIDFDDADTKLLIPATLYQ